MQKNQISNNRYKNQRGKNRNINRHSNAACNFIHILTQNATFSSLQIVLFLHCKRCWPFSMTFFCILSFSVSYFCYLFWNASKKSKSQIINLPVHCHTHIRRRKYLNGHNREVENQATGDNFVNIVIGFFEKREEFPKWSIFHEDNFFSF